MNKIPYTPQEMADKFICCFPLFGSNSQKFGCVVQEGGPHDGHPYLYNSIKEAESDRYFEPGFDKVVPASEYFVLIGATNE